VKRFEVIEHTADIGIVAYGTDLKEAFANVAYGVFSLITDLDKVRETVCQEVEVAAEEQESLVVVWLNELIYLMDTENMLFKRFEISELSDTRLKAWSYGEKMDPHRHNLKMGVKAATYHMLQIEKDELYRIQVILDV
jgi:SHS2 domain-containing protein